MIFATFIIPSLSLFAPGESAVHILKEKDFKAKVLDTPEDWIVEFYAPWCGHCKSSANDVKEASNILKGIVNIGVVDATEQKQLATKYGVSSYPTIKFFREGKDSQFQKNERTFDVFMDFGLQKMRENIKRRLKTIKETQSL